MLAYRARPPGSARTGMEPIESLIESGRVLDVMGAFVALEVVVLLAFWRRTGRGVPPASLLLNLGAGGSLMLAFRAVLLGSGALVAAAWLLASLVFHVADLARRWQG